MKISSPSRNISARKPSHLGSKVQSPSAGNSSTRFASIGRIGGFTGRCTPHGITWVHLLIAAEKEHRSEQCRFRAGADQGVIAPPSVCTDLRRFRCLEYLMGGT